MKLSQVIAELEQRLKEYPDDPDVVIYNADTYQYAEVEFIQSVILARSARLVISLEY